MRRFIRRLADVFRRERVEEELEREIGAHLALLEDEYRRRGMTTDEARFAARRALGSAHAKDLHRDARSFVWLDDLCRDITHAARSLRRNPGFAAVAVLTLALGIGANTAIFSVVRAVLLRPLPYPNADRLVQVYATFPVNPRRIAARQVPPQPWSFDALRRHTLTLSDVAGYVLSSATLTGQGDAVRLTGVEASASLFPLLGVSPQLGRSFTAREEAAGADAVVVLSHAAWQRYFNGDATVVGRVIAMDGQGRTVVGVMPEGFPFPDPTTQFWVPYVVPPRNVRSYINPSVIARLRDGVTRDAAESEVNALLAEEGWTGARYGLAGVQDEFVAPVKPALMMLVVAVALVLLIACVNVANLLLVRTASRDVEIALRRAIGASPGRVIRQLLTESTWLALLGAAAGTALAYGGIFLLRSLATSLPRRDLGPGISLPRLDEIAIDSRVLIFTIALAIVTGVICGLIPALRHSKPRRADVLRERAASPRLSGALVVGEIAMAMVLLVGGGLLIHSFVRLATTDRGYDASQVVTFQSTGRQTAGPQARAFAEQLVERIATLPGVIAAGYANNLPLVQQGFGRDVSPAPPTRGQPARTPQPGVHAVSPRFTAALGLRVVAGRGFSDGEAALHEALVTRAFARSPFFDGPPLGSHIYTGRGDWEVVGILEDVNQFSLEQHPDPELFIVDFVPPPPGLGGSYFAVRTSSDPDAIAASVRAVVRQLDSSATVENVATMEQIVSNAMSRPRLYAVLLGIFAAVAMALAAIGIYGVLAFIVTHRTREIGIRVALGARRGQVIALILRNTAMLTCAGVVIGLGGAAALSRYLEGLLFGVKALDVSTFVLVVTVFVLVAALAAFVPARRATRVDPAVALRAE